jgi:hypothetical protein
MDLLKNPSPRAGHDCAEQNEQSVGAGSGFLTAGVGVGRSRSGWISARPRRGFRGGEVNTAAEWYQAWECGGESLREMRKQWVLLLPAAVPMPRLYRRTGGGEARAGSDGGRDGGGGEGGSGRKKSGVWSGKAAAPGQTNVTDAPPPQASPRRARPGLLLCTPPRDREHERRHHAAPVMVKGRGWLGDRGGLDERRAGHDHGRSDLGACEAGALHLGGEHEVDLRRMELLPGGDQQAGQTRSGAGARETSATDDAVQVRCRLRWAEGTTCED